MSNIIEALINIVNNKDYKIEQYTIESIRMVFRAIRTGKQPGSSENIHANGLSACPICHVASRGTGLPWQEKDSGTETGGKKEKVRILSFRFTERIRKRKA